MAARKSHLLLGAGCGLLFLLACGGGGMDSHASSTQPPAAPGMTAGESQAFTETFLHSEGNPSLLAPFLNPASSVPMAILPASPVAIPACAQVSVERPTLTSVKVTLVLSDCPRGAATVSGRVVINASAPPPIAAVSFEPLAVHAGTKTWTLSGVKGFTGNAATREFTIQTTNIGVAFTDGANPAANRSYAYSCNLAGSGTGDGSFRIWGSFSFAASDGSTVSANIAKDAALLYTPACCYPTSGTIDFTRNGASAQVSFLASCGTVMVTLKGGAAETRTLAACN